ncbi:MAG: DUF481 domain-containing protein [Pseudoalteromonas spongiae]|uniref:DUF481 domain-containing protein n=1 Tax=Pseudoalteromonas TaxID=53246 RepID=UPI0006D61B63|nr:MULTISPECIES: DUF481 domain-containing protein [Pseudoalteromonas]KPV97387.1 hypothetical protein AN214_00893 [Pseudoalteromonas sp. P1-9]MCF6456976.1 DUF481 domain-containing protein [Pseudoalteromonas sp. MMG024]
MRWIVFFYCVLFCSKLLAADPDPFEDFAVYGETPSDERYEQNKGRLLFGDLELGFIVTTGNTNTASAKLKTNIMQDLNNWRNQLKFDSLVKKDNDNEEGDELSATRYFTSLQSNYLLEDKNNSLFLYGDYEFDRFSGIEKQASFVAGYGWRFLENRKDSIDLDVGPGVNYQVSETDESDLGYLLRLALQWERIVSKRTRFNQDISAEHSLSGLNSRIKSETSLVSQISGALSLKFSYLYRYNTMPEEGKRNYDAETSATFVFSFN